MPNDDEQGFEGALVSKRKTRDRTQIVDDSIAQRTDAIEEAHATALQETTPAHKDLGTAANKIGKSDDPEEDGEETDVDAAEGGAPEAGDAEDEDGDAAYKHEMMELDGEGATTTAHSSRAKKGKRGKSPTTPKTSTSGLSERPEVASAVLPDDDWQGKLQATVSREGAMQFERVASMVRSMISAFKTIVAGGPFKDQTIKSLITSCRPLYQKTTKKQESEAVGKFALK